MAYTFRQQFTAADGANATTLTPDVGTLSLANDGTANWTVQSNRAFGISDSRNVTQDAQGQYHTVGGVLRLVSAIATKNEFTLYTRFGSTNQHYRVVIDQTNGTAKLFIVYFSPTQLGSTYTLPTWSVGSDLRVELVIKDSGGQKLEVWINNTLAIGPTADTSYTSQSGRSCGFGCSANTNPTSTTGIHIDDFWVNDAFPTGAASVAFRPYYITG